MSTVHFSIATTLLSLCLTFAEAPAATLAGVTLPNKIEVNQQSLVLNGLGLREATVFKVDVYVAGLYLEAKSNDAAGIVQSPQTKRLTLHFLRNVSADKLRAACRDGFQANAVNVEYFENEIDTFQACLQDVSEGDVMSFTIHQDNVEIRLDGEPRGTIHGREFAQAFLAIWLGNAPPNPKLKSGLLGAE